MQKEVTVEELNDYLNEVENGVIKSFSKGDVFFSLTYIPASLLAFHEVNGNMKGLEYDSLKSNFNKFIYFKFEIASGAITSGINTYSDFHVEGFTDKGSEIPLVDLVYNNLGFQESYLFVFENCLDDVEDLSIKVSNKVITESLTFNYSDLLKVPSLNFYKKDEIIKEIQ